MDPIQNPCGNCGAKPGERCKTAGGRYRRANSYCGGRARTSQTELVEEKTFMDVGSLIECLQEISTEYENGSDLDVYTSPETLLTHLEVRRSQSGKGFVRLI